MKFSTATLVAALACTTTSSVSAFSITRSTGIRTPPSLLYSSTIEKEQVTVNGDAMEDGAMKKSAPVAEEIQPSFPVVVEESKPAAVAASSPSTPAPVVDKNKIQPGRFAESEYSIAIPFLKRPSKLDGTHAGDFGFDPLGLTEEWDLYTMQEAEIRHARLAMLAVVGWPLSELVAPSWMLQENGCAPSVLNGFNPLSFVAVVAAFSALGFFEYKTALRKTDDTPLGKIHHDDMSEIWKYGVAGDYSFDPLNLYESIGNDAYARKGLREVEISHGRSAMLGITGFAMWEFLTGHPIVENSMFFHPNALLPVLVAAYVAFGQFYEFDEESSEMFFRFKMSSEGEARMENLKMGLGIGRGSGSNDESVSIPDFDLSSLSEMPEKIANAANSLKAGIDKLQDSYMDNVVQPDKKE
ncbi:chlorophyll A-B binding protein [Nitzschia inconspicua]|uniref:Chlorophyll A-B binding protein n=1 Tax=Nitzschia inconspicua TaxID=303405 RepID=A0A9K3Q711_9STRA|nr:chlorophyll A-B binding protein [Nitzschia inconspicua]